MNYTYPDYKILKSPIIICGAGGGGTSYVTKLLRYNGLFGGTDAGPKKDRKYHESRAMKEINTVSCRLFGFQKGPANHYLKRGNPEKNIIQLTEGFLNNYYREKSIELMTNGNLPLDIAPHGFSIMKYIDIFWGAEDRNITWGFKDPKNGITLPIWKEIFPNPKLLLIKKEVDSKESKSGEGKMFREGMTDFVRGAHMIPLTLDKKNDDYHIVQFEEVVNDHEKFNELCKWAGLQTLTKEGFLSLLNDTKFEKGV